MGLLGIKTHLVSIRGALTTDPDCCCCGCQGVLHEASITPTPSAEKIFDVVDAYKTVDLSGTGHRMQCIWDCREIPNPAEPYENLENAVVLALTSCCFPLPFLNGGASDNDHCCDIPVGGPESGCTDLVQDLVETAIEDTGHTYNPQDGLGGCRCEDYVNTPSCGASAPNVQDSITYLTRPLARCCVRMLLP